MARKGRPPANGSTARSETVRVRVTPAGQAALDAEAARCGVDVSTLARTLWAEALARRAQRRG